MNWGAIFWIVMALAGTALVVGGAILYRSGRNPAWAGAGVAVGIIRWGILLFTLAVSSSVE